MRGIYNLTLKSLGAARKRHGCVRLDGCVEYGAPMPAARGYYFMDSPGNDLESISGQLASGCTLVAFTTGNGSVASPPLAPTVKIVTTSAKFARVRADMDFDAEGAHNAPGCGAGASGAPDGRARRGAAEEEEEDDDKGGIESSPLGRSLFALLLAVASGERTAGEREGACHLQLWRS